MKRLFPIALTLILLGSPALCPAQSDGPAVRDHASMFSPDAVRKADETLRTVQKNSRWRVVIESIESLQGKTPAERAAANARALDVHGLYVLFAKHDKKFELMPSESARQVFTKDKLDSLTKTLGAAFKAGDFDQGLLDLVAQVQTLASAHPSGPPVATSHRNSASPASGIRDRAGMFSPDAVEKANRTLESVREKGPWRVAIETVDSLDGQPIRERAAANARTLDVHGLYVLIAKKDKKYEFMPSESARQVFTKDKLDSLTKTLGAAFKTGDFDRGLLQTVEEIEKTSVPGTFAVKTVKPFVPISPSPPAPVKEAARPASPPTKEFNILPLLIIGCVGFLVFLWIMSKIFGGKPQVPQQPQGWQAAQPGPGPQPGYGPAPPRPMPTQPGYAPAPGYGPQPGYGPPPGPGYPAGGYGAPPPQHGGAGGFVAGALGGLGGAIAGNILYDKFGRPHHEQGGPTSQPVPGGSYPPLPAAEGGMPPQHESFDPNAGATGDWGGEANQPAPPPDQWGGEAGNTGDWGGGGQETGGAGGAGGDWGGGESTSEPQSTDGGASGDWGDSAPEPSQDAGSGDWGGNDGGGNPADGGDSGNAGGSEAQEGSW